MKKIRIVFGTHNSQPLGTYDQDFEQAYQKAYKPFLTTLYNLPEVFLTLHYSGILLQWLEEKHPEFLMLLNDMIKRKQVEIIGGAFFEPILPLIPLADRIGQIEALTTFLRKRFGKRPRGCWVPERVWEPTLASMFSSSGMDFVFLDDWHFRSANLDESEIYAPCYTEDQGKLIAVYPLSSELRRMIPETPPEKLVEKMISLQSETEERILVILVDGNRLGLPEGSHEWCYEKGWLQKFLSLLLAQKDTFRFTNPAKYIKYSKPEKKVYFSCTSYEEMMDWSLPARRRSDYSAVKTKLSGQEAQKGFIRGGHFRQFLTKYPESNFMYSKMMYTTILVNQIRGDKYRKKTAKEELWKGQCNNAYWYGSQGGIYANHLRKSVYQCLLEAEKTTHEKGVFIPSIITTDFDMDGKVEYLYQGYDINAYVHVKGGILFELDYFPISWNYLDTMSRHPEDDNVLTETGLPSDWYLRRSFIDHVFNGTDGIGDFDSMHYRELGNFVDGLYEVIDFNREKNSLDLNRIGNIETGTGTSLPRSKAPLHIQKKYLFKRSSIDVHYSVRNPGETELGLVFGVELNFSLVAMDKEHMSMQSSTRGGEPQELELDTRATESIDSVQIKDLTGAVNISIHASSSFNLWSLPVETQHKTLSGSSEKKYQSSCFILRWPLALKPGDSWETKITVSLSRA
ncbi:MAG: DUF1926 domain-containing protein [Spirochaetales bacterium]|nr:MAG: DUF1926 domain-containing protein [Spirochaetales bacterium]